MKLLILGLTLFLTACGAGTFTVSQVDNSLSADKSPAFVSENNRISSKSIAGGVHIDASGVYLNPFVIKNAETGRPDVVGFNIINKTEYNTAYGGVNQLGYIQRLTFSVDGDLITTPVVKQSSDGADTLQYNALTRSASYAENETGLAVMTVTDFERVAHAKVLSCKIEGTRQAAVYSPEDIAAGFVGNVGKFYDQYVK